jgi:hypothetical protein
VRLAQITHAIKAAWPEAECVVTDGLGHRGALSDPQTIRRVIEFID